MPGQTGVMTANDMPTNIKYGPPTRDASGLAAVGALVGGATDLIGTSMQNQANMDMLHESQRWSETQAEKANAFTEKQAATAREFDQLMSQRAMDFSERMASTQHQREVNDLRAAGLNPILSMGGSGAAAPSGVSANSPSPSGQMASLPSGIAQKNIFEGMSSTIMQALNMWQKIQMNDALTDNLAMQLVKGGVESELLAEKRTTEQVQQDYIRAQTEATRANSHGMIKFNEILDDGSKSSKWAGLVKMAQVGRAIFGR